MKVRDKYVFNEDLLYYMPQIVPEKAEFWRDAIKIWLDWKDRDIKDLPIKLCKFMAMINDRVKRVERKNEGTSL